MPSAEKMTSHTLGVVLNAVNAQIATDAQNADYEARGKKVKQARNYVDGDHDARLTKEKIDQLNLPVGTQSAFTANYCETVVETMVDRISLDTIETDNDMGTQWVQRLLDYNDFDSLQVDVHEAAVRDGDCGVIIWHDDASDQVMFTLEPAWDGTKGIIFVYADDGGRRDLECAIKVWSEMEVLRANYYYADRVERWATAEDGKFQLFDSAPLLDGNGDPFGVPVVHFSHRRQKHENYGLSELENAIPIQDALNRTVHSMVMSSEYQAYQLRYSIGLPSPSKISPGAWVEWSEKTPDGKTKLGIGKDRSYEVGHIPQGELSPFIDECWFFIEQMSYVTRTPFTALHSRANISGEALKELDREMVSKVNRFNTKSTSSWRQVMKLAHKTAQTYVQESPPDIKRFYPRWKSAEVRNNSELVANANAVRDDIPREEYLRILAPVFGWDEEKIQGMTQKLAEEETARAMQLGSYLPDFSSPSNSFSANGGT